MPKSAPKHGAERRKRIDRDRGSAYQRGYSRQWRKARLEYLAMRPLCVACESEGIVKAANVVDHVRPHRGNPGLFWDVNNWQPLCKRHHDEKTARGE